MNDLLSILLAVLINSFNKMDTYNILLQQGAKWIWSNFFNNSAEIDLKKQEEESFMFIYVSKWALLKKPQEKSYIR